MQQISVSGVNLEHPKTRLARAPRRSGECGHNFLNTFEAERLRHGEVMGEGNSARRNNLLPPSVTLGNRSVTGPGCVGAGLATGVRQLHPGYCSLLMDKPDDSRQWLNMIVFPDSQILRTDPSLGKNCRCFGKYQSRAANGPAAQMHKMPVTRVSVRAGVLTHGRYKYPVGKLDIPNRQWIEQVRHRVAMPF